MRRHEELRKEWLRRKRWVFIAVAAVLIGSAALFNALYLIVLPNPYMAGFASGMALATILATRQLTPNWIDNWMIGARGERKTQEQLRLLPPGWTVEHDIDTGHGNIDHLMIGPAGVFILDSKFWGGPVSVHGDRAIIDLWGRRPWVWEGTTTLRRHARETTERIRANTRIVQWVQPVVVVWSEFEAGVQQDGVCTFVAGDRLVEWLLAQPDTVHESRLPLLTEAVTTAWNPALD